MKMETTITAPRDFTVTKIVLKEKTLVEQDDSSTALTASLVMEV